MNERFHGPFHLAPPWRRNLVILDEHRSFTLGLAKLLDALLHDPDRLAHLFHPDQVTVVAIAIPADRNIEVHLRIAVVRLRFTKVPSSPRSPHHYPRETPSPCLIECHSSDIDVTLFEYAV